MSQPDLRHDHPYIYRRVRLKAVIFTLLGLSLIAGITNPANQRGASQVTFILPYGVWGAIFLLIGIGIAFGLTRQGNNYRVARYFLAAAAGYALFWLISLAGLFFTGRLSSTFLIILWGYLTYNLFLLTTDPGWTVAQIVKELRDGKRG